MEVLVSRIFLKKTRRKYLFSFPFALSCDSTGLNKAVENIPHLKINSEARNARVCNPKEEEEVISLNPIL